MPTALSISFPGKGKLKIGWVQGWLLLTGVGHCLLQSRQKHPPSHKEAFASAADFDREIIYYIHTSVLLTSQLTVVYSATTNDTKQDQSNKTENNANKNV